MLHSTKTLNSQLNVVSQRPPAQRVAWFLPPMAVKDRGAKCPVVENNAVKRWILVQSIRIGTPNTNYLLNSES